MPSNPIDELTKMFPKSSDGGDYLSEDEPDDLSYEVSFGLFGESGDTKNARNHQINQQMKAYKDQTELTRQQIDAVRNEKDAQKRRINEKQIRALRRNYSGASTAGFLGSQSTDQPGMSSKLGG